MSRIDLDTIDVEKIYRESMLAIEEGKKEETIKKFKDVVENVGSIFDLDTEGVEYFEITSEIKSPLREDEPEESIDREVALKNTKHREYGYFKIGKVVD